VEGRELKLNRLTANKKLRKVRWLPLNETGQKSDSMFATIIRTALLFLLFYLFQTEFFQYPDVGGVYLKKIHSKITGQVYLLSLLFLCYISAPLLYFVIFNLKLCLNVFVPLYIWQILNIRFE